MSVEELHHIELHGQALGRYLFERARELLADGESANSIKAVLISFYDWLGDEGREEDQDAVADVMDSLTGFCSPTARLDAS